MATEPSVPSPILDLPPALLARPEFTAACRRRDFAAVFALLKRYGISQVRIGTALDMTTSRVGEILHYKHKITTIEVIERVSDRLHIPGHMLGLAPRPWESRARPPKRPYQPTEASGDVLDAAWTADGTITAAREATHVNPLDRRSFLLLTGAALTAPAHEWLLASPLAEASRGGHRTVTLELVNHLDATVDQLRRLDDQIGGAPLLDLVRQQTGRVIDLLDNGRYTDTVGRRLHSTAAELLRLTGWTCHDADRNAEAQRYFIAALHAAHAAGDRALGAGILHYMSNQASYLGRVREAVTLAETARSGYRGASPRVRTLLALAAAQAHASAGERDESERAIGAAQDAFGDNPPSHGEPEWCYWIGRSDIDEHAGFSYLFLQDWTRASDHLAAALRDQEPDRTRESVLRNIVLAGAYAQQGEPERACHVGGTAIDLLTGQVNSPRCVDRLGRLTEQLTPYRTLPAVRALTERTRELAAAGSSA